jgi:hypothetical protein
MSSVYWPGMFFLDVKFKRNTFKPNELVSLIFSQIKFSAPIRANGRQKLTLTLINLKIKILFFLNAPFLNVRLLFRDRQIVSQY